MDRFRNPFLRRSYRMTTLNLYDSSPLQSPPWLLGSSADSTPTDDPRAADSIPADERPISNRGQLTPYRSPNKGLMSITASHIWPLLDGPHTSGPLVINHGTMTGLPILDRPHTSGLLFLGRPHTSGLVLMSKPGVDNYPNHQKSY
jgi:hypothetical protein